MTPTRKQSRGNWPKLRARLTAVAATLGAGAEMTPDEEAHILKERARRLAAPPVSEPDHMTEFLIFDLGKARYALESRFVVTVSPLGALVPIPGAPETFLGVTNLQGVLLPVVDLKALLGAQQRRQPAEKARLIVLGRSGPDVGVIADNLDGLALLQTHDLAQSPLDTASPDQPSYIRGVTRDRIILIDAAQLLDGPNLRIRPPSPASS